MYHVYGFMNGWLAMTGLGGLLVLVPDPRDSAALLRAWSMQPIHLFSGTSTLYQAILATPSAATQDFSDLRLCSAGGMATSPRVAHAWQALTGRNIHEGFGLSETCSAVASNPWQHATFSGTAGVPLPGVDVRIIDAEGAPVPPGTCGELCVRGPMVMAGYWGKPEESAAVLGADGFLRTGDIARLTERGHLQIVDRKKDMILVSGFNVYPSEVEAVLCAHPGVLECAVFGIAAPDGGESVCAAVVARVPGLDQPALREWCRDQLTGYKQPQRIVFCAALPKSAVGKILRRELRGLIGGEQVD
jgi:long-chain acyl-CoA synthetase